jgi:hypothetical protein
MSQLKAPKKPIADWEKVRDEWVRAVEQLIADVEGWCKANDWPTRRIEKHIEESKIGEYVVPALVIQVDLVKLMLEPGARFVSGADGVCDLYRMPQYDDVAVVRWCDGNWQLKYDVYGTGTGPAERVEPFTAEALVALVKRVS